MRSIILFFIVLFSFGARAQESGGVYLGATRLVYVSSSKTASLSVGNSSDKDIWLVRSWVSSANLDYESADDVPFVVTPPLYRLDSGGSIAVRINSWGGALPMDRESLFYINVAAIPPTKKTSVGDGGKIQFSLNNKIKMFYRPDALSDYKLVSSAYKKITVQVVPHGIRFKNPTPYYITLTQLKLNDATPENESGLMLAPFGESTLPHKGRTGKLSFKSINDFGGFSDAQIIDF